MDESIRFLRWRLNESSNQVPSHWAWYAGIFIPTAAHNSENRAIDRQDLGKASRRHLQLQSTLVREGVGQSNSRSGQDTSD